MTTLSEFSAYYMRIVWREGDTSFSVDLPKLIKEAEARISRDLRDSNIVGEVTLAVPTGSESIPLPADFREMISADFHMGTSARAVDFPTIKRMRQLHHQYRHDNTLYYAISGGHIHFANWMLATEAVPAIASSNYVAVYTRAKQNLPGVTTVGEEVAVTLSYYKGITPMSDSDELSFYDLHPDFFIAAVHAQAYSYLRDFDLSAEFNGRYLALLDDMRRQSNYTMFPSGQLTTPLTDAVK